MLKLNVGLTKKVGEANYGSRGASVNLELELDSSLAGDADKLKDRIRQLFTMARASVEEELSASGGQGSTGKAENGHHAESNGATNGCRKRDNTRAATASQVRALNAIADRLRIDLLDKLHIAYGTRDPAELSITEASQLIDELKGACDGAGGRR